MAWIVAVVGMPASGKSTAARMLSRMLGCPIIVMGDAVRRETERRGLPLTPENIEWVAAQLRAEMGRGAVAHLVLGDVRRAIGERGCAIVEGARSPEEIPVLAEAGRVCIVAVHASPRRRLERLRARGRPGETGWEALRLRDRANLDFGVGELIALADYMIVNEWGLEELEEQVSRVAEELSHGSWKGCSGGGGQAGTGECRRQPLAAGAAAGVAGPVAGRPATPGAGRTGHPDPVPQGRGTDGGAIAGSATAGHRRRQARL